MDILKYSMNYLLLPGVIFFLVYVLQSKFSLKWNDRLSAWMVSKDIFYRRDVARSDEMILNLVRIVLGCFLLFRLLGIAEFALPLEPGAKELLALGLYFVLLVAFTVGFIAPISTLLLLLYQLHFNLVLKTYTLGVDVTAMILVCMVLYPVGRVFSVDAHYFSNVRWVKSVYRRFSHENRVSQVVTAKSVAFLSYCFLCLYSVLLHLDEPLWLNGDAAVHLLGSSYLSKYYDFFQYAFTNYAPSVWLAKFCMLAMVIWYFALGPAVLMGGLWRRIALLWAVAFFLLSVFVLQLSILGYIEFLLFGVLFWNLLIPKNRKHVNMLYDDRCNLCDKTVRFLKVVDFAGVIKFLPISKNREMASKVGVSEEELRNDLYSWNDGSNEVHSGYEFYLHISKKLLVLHAFFPILLLFKWCKIGPITYRFIAARRIAMFGECKLPVDDELTVTQAFDVHSANLIDTKGFFKPFLITSLSFALFFLAIMPINPFSDELQARYRNIVRSAHILSWSRINVFNAVDLKMTSHYYTAAIDLGDDDILLPITGEDGSRLNWHNSDRVYFGNTLKWRRIKNNKPILPPTRHDYRGYCEVLMWAKNKGFSYENGLSLTFYQAKWPSVGVSKVRYFPAEEVGSLIVKPEKCGID